MSRKKAREIAFHLVFEMGFREFEADEVLADRLDDSLMSALGGDIALYAGKLDNAQTKYICEVVKGVAANLSELDKTIEKYSRGWKLSRLSRVTIAILRLALYEMNNVSDVPVGAAINEAVELAKTYDAEEAAAFINGILGSVARAQNGEQPETVPSEEAKPETAGGNDA
ncbi:transcription antitermination factor NusB [Agathobaculum sp.]|uniref:transcription antitermination factor NusB n=1 Tax=Agathobaculum sp. TaxID=2048138 RepID=UPI002A802033|nr:transcription antitermination factor NusB [Agathobaculum sp.]MDY3618516.1 transcription antitermination factor NusB [Agathobaculum sp.]